MGPSDHERHINHVILTMRFVWSKAEGYKNDLNSEINYDITSHFFSSNVKNELLLTMKDCSFGPGRALSSFAFRLLVSAPTKLMTPKTSLKDSIFIDLDSKFDSKI